MSFPMGRVISAKREARKQVSLETAIRLGRAHHKIQRGMAPWLMWEDWGGTWNWFEEEPSCKWLDGDLGTASVSQWA
jgi:hypothetical protein